MSSLVQEIIKDLLPEGNKKTTAVYGGGFKPPTKGHFEVVQTALKKNPSIDEFIILIGGKERDGITQTDSLLIWEIYKKYLPINVNVVTDSKPPIQGVYNYAKEHPNEDVIFVIGAREGNEEDFTDIASRTRAVDNYPNLRVETVVTQGGVSGTAARNAAKISFEKFRPFLPSELTDEEAREIFDIVSQSIQEKQDCWDGYKPGKPKTKISPKTGKRVNNCVPIKENASYSKEIDVKNEIAKLTKHMISKGMNIEPLPKLIFKNGDVENAKQFLGKTAYYDPNNQSIVLYTEGRHPKDIVRSFAHEMIHHIQNLEGRLGDITTTNTQEDDHLDKLEQEANLKGTMTFRNWTDSLNERKDPFGINAYARELAMLREEEGEYKVYLDMDGVLADFDKRFTDLAGMGPREFEDKYGKNKFWDFIDEEHKIKFWVGIPVMPGAKALVDYVRPYNYEILSAPSMKKQSRLGKNLWIKNHIGDVFGSKPIVNFKQAKEKHLIKPQLSKFDILVDDRADTIDRWNAAGGTGILYTSAGQTINALKKLGL